MSRASGDEPRGVTIRPLDPSSADEIALVARRMRATLVEVLGAERGDAMYDDAWLTARVRFHLDGADGCGAAVFLAVDGSDAVLGHCIVRVVHDDAGGAESTEDAADARFGLFSTTYVEPSARRRGVADALLTAGEAWMRARGLAEARTFTDASNAPLHALYVRRGYQLTRLDDEWVRLSRQL